MKQRYRRKQFLWVWHHCGITYKYHSGIYGVWDWGMGRIKDQIKK